MQRCLTNWARLRLSALLLAGRGGLRFVDAPAVIGASNLALRTIVLEATISTNGSKMSGERW